LGRIPDGQIVLAPAHHLTGRELFVGFREPDKQKRTFNQMAYTSSLIRRRARCRIAWPIDALPRKISIKLSGSFFLNGLRNGRPNGQKNAHSQRGRQARLFDFFLFLGLLCTEYCPLPSDRCHG